MADNEQHGVLDISFHGHWGVLDIPIPAGRTKSGVLDINIPTSRARAGILDIDIPSGLDQEYGVVDVLITQDSQYYGPLDIHFQRSNSQFGVLDINFSGSSHQFGPLELRVVEIQSKSPYGLIDITLQEPENNQAGVLSFSLVPPPNTSIRHGKVITSDWRPYREQCLIRDVGAIKSK